MSELYYTSPYEKEFVTEITHIEEKENAYHIVLQSTAFYPGGNEMPCDIGFIEDSPITYVYEKNQVIYHVSPKKPIKIHKAKCRINWARRFHYMQHYTSMHLISASLLNDFKIECLKVQLEEELSTLTLSHPLSSEQLLLLESTLNQQISDNLTLSTFVPTKQELKKLRLKKAASSSDSPIRVVQIEDLDPLICDGLVVKSTLELQLIKLVETVKNKTSASLTFMAGQNAVQHLLHPKDTSKSQLQDLTAKCQLLTSKVQKLTGIIDDYKAKEVVASAPTIASYRIVKAVYEDMEPKALQSFANKLTALPHVIVLLGLKVERTAYLFFMCSKEQKSISMNALLKDSITLIDGQGGGTDFSAQGGGKSASNLESALDYALQQVESKLSL